MKNNDFDFISSKFDEEKITAPKSLSAENTVKNFDKKNVSNIVKIKGNTRAFKSFIAAVACVAIVITSVSFGIKAARQPVKFTDSNPRVEGISYFKNYDSLNAKLGEIMTKQGGGIIKSFGSIKKEMYMADGEVEESEAANGDKAITMDGSSAGKASHAETNKQVDAVDEADIVKTDGKYIYHILNNYNYDSGSSSILIYSADKGKTKLVSKINDGESKNKYIEMYISGNKLIAVGVKTDFFRDYYFSSADYTFVEVYDLENIREPKLVNEYRQDGYYLTSRFVNDTVYIVSDYYRHYYNKRKDIDSFIPRATNAKGEFEKLPVDNICCIDDCARSGYSVIGAIDVNGKKDKTYKTKAILGSGDKLYCNEDNLYLATTEFKSGSVFSKGYTRLVKLSLNKTKLSLVACGEVKGTVNDQFSLDEKDGKLRIATTQSAGMDGDRDVNFLFVLDSKLKKIGEVSGFAKDEHIEAVRYIGNTAYVITFERTDPLFIIDLSNPKAPKITGEVKIDGFSSSLTPIDENTLLGIGYATRTNEFGGVQTNGLKLVVFDISDKGKPKVVSEKELTSYSSPAQENHKAIVVNKEKGYFAIPMNSVAYGNEAVGIIKADDSGLQFKKLDSKTVSGGDDVIIEDAEEYTPYDNVQMERCTYIGDYVYALNNTETDTLEAFEVK